MPRIIDRYIQLITQSNDCCLLTYSEMKIRFERAWDLIEFTRNPEEYLYLHPNGRAFAQRKPWIGHYSHSSNIPYYHQKARLLHIHKNGRICNDPHFMFSLNNKSLFLRFINSKNRMALKNLMGVVQGFCIFPSDQDKARLIQQYKKSLGAENYHFLFPMNSPLPQKKEREEVRITEVINKINLDYLWEKKRYLQKLVQSYYKGKMNMRELANLYRHMTHVSEIFLDEQDFNLKKISKDMDADGDGIISDTRNFNDVIGEKKLQDVKTLVVAYRVYGHFALCCLEFFLTIQDERNITQCKACKQYYEKSHGSQAYCSIECKKAGTAERSRKYRIRKK